MFRVTNSDRRPIGNPLRAIVGSLLPVGLAQTWASLEKGYWYARSTEFLGLPYMQTPRWLRVPGDTIFAVAALVLVAFVFVGRSGRPGASKSRYPAPSAFPRATRPAG